MTSIDRWNATAARPLRHPTTSVRTKRARVSRGRIPHSVLSRALFHALSQHLYFRRHAASDDVQSFLVWPCKREILRRSRHRDRAEVLSLRTEHLHAVRARGIEPAGAV